MMASSRKLEGAIILTKRKQNSNNPQTKPVYDKAIRKENNTDSARAAQKIWRPIMNTNMNNTDNTVYLVTSAAGFMGGIVVRKLLERGERVRAFVLKGDPAVKYVPAGAEIFEGDVCDKESLERFFTVPQGTETVCLHIASLVSVDPEYDQKVMDVNVGGAQNIIDCCVTHTECRKLVYVSSTGASPALPKGQKIT